MVDFHISWGLSQWNFSCICDKPKHLLHQSKRLGFFFLTDSLHGEALEHGIILTIFKVKSLMFIPDVVGMILVVQVLKESSTKQRNGRKGGKCC